MSYQRFCPVCDRPFLEGDAVLRCEGCSVLHHPSCWVRNEGCVTAEEHHSAPIAEAYGGGRPAPRMPHPAEGTRVRIPARERPEGPPPQRFSGQREPAGPRDPSVIGGDDFGDEVIGDTPDPVVASRERRPRGAPPTEQVPFRPKPPRRYQDRPEPAAARRPLPQVYSRPRLLDYWYVPVAVAIAVVVAFGVIWVSERIFGGSGDDNTPAVTDLPREQNDSGNAPATETSPTPTPVPGGTFIPGDIVVVTGSGECLNVRPSPGLDNEPVACLPDGSEFEILSGPQIVGDLTWWEVRTEQGDGWAAEDYLRRR